MRLFFLFPLLFFFFAAAADAQGLIFVVNKDNPVTELKLSEIADYYFKKRLRWPNGTKVQFIDQRDGTSQKTLFLGLIQKTQRDVDLFWIGEKNFSGSSAPLRAPSDALVISMVGSLAGGLGYVSEDRSVLGNAKRITVKMSE